MSRNESRLFGVEIAGFCRHEPLNLNTIQPEPQHPSMNTHAHTHARMHAGFGFSSLPRGGAGARGDSFLGGGPPPGEMRGLRMVCNVSDVRLKDLQGSVEHRMVLAANASTVRSRGRLLRDGS